jgi:hypothetical protein
MAWSSAAVARVGAPKERRSLSPGRTILEWRARGDSNSQPLASELVFQPLAYAESEGWRCGCRQPLGSLGRIGSILCNGLCNERDRIDRNGIHISGNAT